MAYLICTDDLDGAMNMALDEVLWQESSSGTQFMRLYRWADRPVLSLGYFQDWAPVRADAPWRALPCVRRLTGGGAIVHDHEITYSLALPASSSPPTNELYNCVHSAIAARLTELGVPATVGDAADDQTADAHLCFSRSDRFAVRVRGVKVLGSAQRRGTNGVLMHGSLLLNRSAAAPGVLGIWDLMGNVSNDQKLEQALVRAVEAALGVRLIETALPHDLRRKALALAHAKYRTTEWNETRRRRHAS